MSSDFWPLIRKTLSFLGPVALLWPSLNACGSIESCQFSGKLKLGPNKPYWTISPHELTEITSYFPQNGKYEAEPGIPDLFQHVLDLLPG